MFDRIAKQLLGHSDALPAEVSAVLTGAHIYMRKSASEEIAGKIVEVPRIVIEMDGPGGVWSCYFSRDELQKRFSKLWPELRASQIDRAIRVITSRVRPLMNQREDNPKRRNWVRDFDASTSWNK